MRKLTAAILIILISVITLTISCKKDKTEISSAGGNASKNMNGDCMKCHKSGGSGTGWFTVAGTDYDSLQQNTYANATITLYSGINATGSLKATVYGDALGNFYTTATVDFTGGLYPSVTGTDGKVKNMLQSITTGSCNSCHDVSTGKLWAR